MQNVSHSILDVAFEKICEKLCSNIINIYLILDYSASDIKAVVKEACM